LVEQYDGVSWALVSTPGPGPGSSSLSGIDAIADNDVWSVGYRTRRRTDQEEAFVEHWNGTQWSIVTTPRLPHSFVTFLSSVSGVASNDVWAVGMSEQHAGLGARPLIEHWNGSVWSIVPSPDPGIGSALVSVEPRASDDVWAVGYTIRNGFEALAEHWDGSSWNVVKVSHPGKTAFLTGVTATSSDVYAVGMHQGRRPLVERWSGSSFQRVSMPRSGGRLGRDGLWAIGTDGSTVWGVGEHDGHGERTLVDYLC
jgi:hypothetical protein